MKVLVINGSPRTKGNSDLLCDEFIRGAAESGNEAEKVSLREKTIYPCKAWRGYRYQSHGRGLLGGKAYRMLKGADGKYQLL